MDFGSLLGSLPALLGSGQGGALLGPSLAGPFDKQGLIAMAQHDRAVWEAEIAVASGPGMVQVNRSFTDPRSAAGSPALLRNLRRMPFRELRLGDRHRGRYVQGRIATPGFKARAPRCWKGGCRRLTSVMVVLDSEEEAGTACKLAVYNLAPPSAGPAQVDRLFPVGTRLAVKEPYFKRYLDGTCGLRVDTPSDVVFLPPASSEPGASSCSGGGDATGGSSDPQELSRRGNELFGRGDYPGSLLCYQRGLEVAEAAPDSVKSTLLSAKAAAHLGLEQWEEAFLAARRALDLDPSATKARHRLARALLHLRCYVPALEHLRTTVQQCPGFKAAAQLLRAAEVLAEQAQGRFTPAALLEGKAAGSSKAPAIADWGGPLEVFDSPTAGRGLRATRAVAAGELLLVERALASAQASPHNSNISFDADGRMNRASQQQLAGTLLQVASASALGRQRVLSLFSGGRGGSKAVAIPAALQPFATEEALLAAVEAARADAATGTSLDLLRAQAAVRFNAWGGEGKEHDLALPAPSQPAAGEHSCVWALLCAANHSCAPNAHVLFVDGCSLAIVRASRPIAAGEEVTVAYNEDAVWQPLHLRRKLLDSWGFRCCCARCVAEADLPRSVQREIEEIVAATGASSDSPGPWRRRYRTASAMGGIGAHALREEVCSRLQRLEASLGLPAAGLAAAGGAGAQVAAFGLASVLQAYRLAAASAQMSGDLFATLQLHSKSLRIISAARPGGSEHIAVAAIRAVDAGGATRFSLLAQRRRMQRLTPAAVEALDQALQAAKTRYGDKLTDEEAWRLLDRLMARIV